MHPTRPPLPLWIAVLVAVVSGPVLALAFPGPSIWPLAFVGLALQLVALIGRRPGGAFLVGFAGALSFYLVLIPWISSFLGGSFGLLSLLPYVALAAFEAVFWGAAAILIALAYRWVPRVAPGAIGRILVLPLVVAGLWVLRESITSTWPFGGFSWGRLAFSQSQSPLDSLFPWIGSAGVSALVALSTAVVIEGVRVSTRATWVRHAAILLVGVAVVMAFPAWQTATTGTMTVAAVQGNSPAGYFTPHNYGDLLLAQYDATLPLVQQGVKPDVVVWPEGATDVDPVTDPRAATYFDYLSAELGAPIVTGDITTAGDITHNSSIVWQAGEGKTGQYDKRHPVPFGEYVPLRSVLEPLAPSLIGLIGREYTPGTNSPILDVGGVAVGANICFDIVDDALLQQTVDGGAQIIFAQSNNADFGTSDESVQQLAIARIRAMEFGRTVVVISTVGQSEIVAPDGSAIDSLTPYQPGAMVDEVPLSTAMTPASAAAVPLGWTFGLLGLAMLIVAGVVGHTKRRPRS